MSQLDEIRLELPQERGLVLVRRVLVNAMSLLTSDVLNKAATFVVYGPGPQIWAVANSASYTSSTLSPGGIITIYGINLGPASLATFAGTDPIATVLPASGSSTTVLIDGKVSPLLYTSATQVSAIVPYAVAAKSGGTVQLTVGYGGVSSTAVTVNVVDADPGLFTVDASGAGQGAILNLNAAGTDVSVDR